VLEIGFVVVVLFILFVLFLIVNAIRRGGSGGG
jgi:cell division protein FtsX